MTFWCHPFIHSLRFPSFRFISYVVFQFISLRVTSHHSMSFQLVSLNFIHSYQSLNSCHWCHLIYAVHVLFSTYFILVTWFVRFIRFIRFVYFPCFLHLVHSPPDFNPFSSSQSLHSLHSCHVLHPTQPMILFSPAFNILYLIFSGSLMGLFVYDFSLIWFVSFTFSTPSSMWIHTRTSFMLFTQCSLFLSLTHSWFSLICPFSFNSSAICSVKHSANESDSLCVSAIQQVVKSTCQCCIHPLVDLFVHYLVKTISFTRSFTPCCHSVLHSPSSINPSHYQSNIFSVKHVSRNISTKSIFTAIHANQ